MNTRNRAVSVSGGIVKCKNVSYLPNSTLTQVCKPNGEEIYGEIQKRQTSKLLSSLIKQSPQIGGGKFQCYGCEKIYLSYHALRTHIKTNHLGIRYFCHHSGCGISYTQKYALVRHYDTVHGEKDGVGVGSELESENQTLMKIEDKVFPCYLCKKNYPCQEYLIHHLEMDHSNQMIHGNLTALFLMALTEFM